MEVLEKLKNSTIIYVMTFAIASMLIAHGMQKTAWTYMPYLRVEVPMMIESEASSCGLVEVKVYRHAWYQMDVKVHTQLTRVYPDGNTEKITDFSNSVIIPQGQSEITKHYPVPCGTQIGTYRYDGIATYKAGDVTRRISFYTSEFQVVK